MRVSKKNGEKAMLRIVIGLEAEIVKFFYPDVLRKIRARGVGYARRPIFLKLPSEIIFTSQFI
jgi:hypothetical protein